MYNRRLDHCSRLPGRTFCFCLMLFLQNVQAETAIPAPEYTKQIVALQQNDQVQSALDHVLSLEPQSQQNLVELTEIPAPPFAEAARAKRFAELLRESGLDDVIIDEVGNVVGHRPGSGNGRVVAYSGHLDTVFPEGTDVTVRFEKGQTKNPRMFAPGIGDNTRGLVNVLAVLRALEHAKIKTEADLLFIGNVGEEGLGDLRGVRHLFREGAPVIDALIAIDGGSSEHIVFGGVGSHRYRITFSGSGGHSWGSFGLANPHHALGRAIQRFVEQAPTVTNKGDKASYSIGRIGGGTSINSIPFESWMEVDMRSGNQRKLDAIDAVFKAALQGALDAENEARLSGQEITLEIESVGNRPAAKGNVHVPLVQRAIAATLAYGIEPQLRISSTDANLPISLGIPAVTMSRGGKGSHSHSPGEWWQNVDGHIAIQIGILTLLSEAGIRDQVDD
ncbi:MAG: M20/M25/M40 family metallo-hydrolase [bacterium]|nr:M20/M25/M40 family metallo-hydrolase [Gammaproteobacteria bacterium]